MTPWIKTPWQWFLHFWGCGGEASDSVDASCAINEKFQEATKCFHNFRRARLRDDNAEMEHWQREHERCEREWTQLAGEYEVNHLRAKRP